jgi:hypothetical protein
MDIRVVVLPQPEGPQQGKEFTLGNAEGDVVHRPVITKILDQAFHR